MGTTLYQGGCHCGTVRFCIRADLSRVYECTCSICVKRGNLSLRVAPGELEILSGEDALTRYRFNTGAATHFFCPRCGIHPFSHPRAAPQAWSVNTRCLDGFPECVRDAVRAVFDGRHYEEALKTFQFSGEPPTESPPRPRES